ncbi:hypothetical protein JYT72_02230 [Crocinitomix catalasitica]|nr:hypothetical protein [Crocinitomix catalasitica]
MKTLIITTLFFASSALYAQSETATETACNCENYTTSAEHCQLILCGSMEGTISNDLIPVSCACIKVWRDDDLMFATKTNSDGTFSMPNVMVGFYTVEIIKDASSYKITNVKMNHDGPTIVSKDLKGLASSSTYTAPTK